MAISTKQTQFDCEAQSPFSRKSSSLGKAIENLGGWGWTKDTAEAEGNCQQAEVFE